MFGSKLGRILQQQGRSQLGIGWSSCRGLTVAEIKRIDFAGLDLSEFTEDGHKVADEDWGYLIRCGEFKLWSTDGGSRG